MILDRAERALFNPKALMAANRRIEIEKLTNTDIHPMNNITWMKFLLGDIIYPSCPPLP